LTRKKSVQLISRGSFYRTGRRNAQA